MNQLLREYIIDWLEKYNVQNYTLLENAEYGYVVDVAGDVDLSEQSLEIIPIKFRTVSGNFNLNDNQLFSLEGCPASVGAYFGCGGNQLTSLKGCPTSINGTFHCNHNQLTSLQYLPTSIGGDFVCHDNKLNSLEYCEIPVGGYFDCCNNQLESLKYLPISVGKGFYGQGFYCDGNPLLGKYQGITDFEKLKEMVMSDREKYLLANSLNTPDKVFLHKV